MPPFTARAADPLSVTVAAVGIFIAASVVLVLEGFGDPSERAGHTGSDDVIVWMLPGRICTRTEPGKRVPTDIAQSAA